MTLEEYRWWVHLWSDSDGNAVVYFDNPEFVTYVPDIDKLFSGITASYTFSGSGTFGSLRIANGNFDLSLGNNRFFEGTCTEQ